MNLGGTAQIVGPALALLLPIGLALWFLRKALAAPSEARASVWFSSFRFLRHLNLGTIALWWILTDLVGLKARAWLLWQEISPGWVPAGRAVFLFCFWIPPIIVLIACQVLFHPVYVRIREVPWTRGELARQAAYGLGLSLVPALFAIGGVTALSSGGTIGDFVVAYALAVFLAIACARALRKHLQLTPNALTTGELRDRAFSLAARLGVKLQQLYLLPPGKSRLANAFARSGNSILLTEVLLTDLNKREVDSVIAHELSHLKQNHPQLLGFALIGGLAAVMIPYVVLAPSESWQPLCDVLFIAVPLLSFYFVSRRFEFAADAGSIRLTGDPAAMITALVRLHQLNVMPLEWSKWSEKGMTHPSTVRRARAIGRAAAMTPERVTELLAAPFLPAAGSAQEHYAAPHPGFLTKVFSSELKRRIAVRAFLWFAALAVLLPSLVLRALGEFSWPSSGWLAFLVTLGLSIAATVVCANYAPLLGYTALCLRLRAKLGRNGVPVDSGDACLVGLSPGNTPRIFESNYAWDIGCLLLRADRFCYWGEETRFALHRAQIVSVEAGPGMADWLRTPFLYIRWRAGDAAQEITFNVRPVEVNSLLAMHRAFGSLARRISTWHSGSPGPGREPNGIESLPLPPAGEVTSSPVHALRNPRLVLNLIMFTALLSGCAAALLKLPIEWLAPVYLAEDTGGYGAFSGWYAILVSLLMVILRFAPVWISREPAAPAGQPVPPPPVPAAKSNPSDAR